MLRCLAIVRLGLVARLEVAAAIAAMRRVLAIAFAAAMTAASAPAAPAPAGSIVRSAFAAILAVLRKLLRGLAVSGSACFVSTGFVSGLLA